MAKIVTANTLATGHVVFRTAANGWAETIIEAALYEDAAAADAALDRSQDDVRRGLIVDPFVTDRGADADGKPAMTLRDTIRAYGPTIRYLPDGAGRG